MSRLGTGSFGVVHVWQNVESGEKIALKKCRFGPEVALSYKVRQEEKGPLLGLTMPFLSKHREQWRQEVDIMLRLSHSNVVKCRPTPAQLAALDPAAAGGGLPLLCMEFCAGGDLRKVLNKATSCAGLSQKEVLDLASDLTSALGKPLP